MVYLVSLILLEVGTEELCEVVFKVLLIITTKQVDNFFYVCAHKNLCIFLV